MSVTVLVGTQKGGFVLRSGKDRTSFEVHGPIFKGWKVTAATRDLTGAYVLATASDVYGPALHRSHDLETFEQLENGPSYDAESGRKLQQIWTLVAGHGRLWAGVDEAGLFVSDDHGGSWHPVASLNDHPTREKWFPGAGGLCLHHVLLHPTDPQRILVGISAVGCFRSDDGGATWAPKNAGIPVIIEDEAEKDIGFCVHALTADPLAPDHLWRQDHVGVFRSRNAGDHWERIEQGLPSGFGFPMVFDPVGRSLFVFPLESDEFRLPPDGAFRVYRSRDGGDSWEAPAKGLPTSRSHCLVLRAAMDVDGHDPCGVYLGTTSGTFHWSSNGGDSWLGLEDVFPRVLCVRAFAS